MPRQVNMALKQSLLEAPQDAGLPLYRPFQEYANVLTKAKILKPTGEFTISGTFKGLPCEGPFVRNPDEISAERVVVLAAARGGVWRVEMAGAHPGTGLSFKILQQEDEPHEPLPKRSRKKTSIEGDIIHVHAGWSRGQESRATRWRGEGHAQVWHRSILYELGQDYDSIRNKFEKDWHEQRWRGTTNDPHRDDHKSTEFGWSTMPGDSPQQQAAKVHAALSHTPLHSTPLHSTPLHSTPLPNPTLGTECTLQAQGMEER
jgi:hypothetical protein